VESLDTSLSKAKEELATKQEDIIKLQNEVSKTEEELSVKLDELSSLQEVFFCL